MASFVEWHKTRIKAIQSRLGVSDYALLWLSFIKGLVIGYLLAVYL
jgi:hypothetical protein